MKPSLPKQVSQLDRFLKTVPQETKDDLLGAILQWMCYDNTTGLLEPDQELEGGDTVAQITDYIHNYLRCESGVRKEFQVVGPNTIWTVSAYYWDEGVHVTAESVDHRKGLQLLVVWDWEGEGNAKVDRLTDRESDLIFEEVMKQRPQKTAQEVKS